MVDQGLVTDTKFPAQESEGLTFLQLSFDVIILVSESREPHSVASSAFSLASPGALWETILSCNDSMILRASATIRSITSPALGMSAILPHT